MRDLKWLKDVGIFNKLKRRDRNILGICGGYEMMFKKLIDRDRVESNFGEMDGLGFIDDEVVFQKHKILKKGSYEIFGKRVKGFEIHNGISKKYPLFFDKNSIKGTFIHALFEDEEFLQYRDREIEKFVSIMEQFIDIDRVIDAII